MKFSKVLTASAVAFLGLTSVDTSSVFAADNTDVLEAQSNAYFTIDESQPEDSYLKLVKVPTLDFGKITTKNVIENTANALSTSDNTDIQVDNYKINNKGWNLKANISSDFANGDTKINGAQITLANKVNKGDATAADTHVLTSTSALVMSSNSVTDSIGTTVSSVADSTLDLTQVSNKKDLTAGKFTAEITWNLTAGPVSKEA